MENETLVKEVFILTERLEEFEKLMNKLNKKAVKLGTAPIKFEITKETIVEEIKDGGYTFYIEKTKVICEGERPILNGWSLVATLVHDSDLGLMINVVPEKKMDEKFRNHDGSCAHCKTKRRRNETYVLEKNIDELTELELQFI